jgi:NAD(P)-dependent dehydrogenase (short-subunit alcohol dehydrogenase family)
VKNKSPKNILITGVSRGLGLAMTEKFIALGHTIFGCARSAERIQALRRRFSKPHQFRVVDVASDEEIAAWANEVSEAGVVPDLVINNAALINANAPLWKISHAEFSSVMDVNVSGTANVIRHFLPLMIRGKRGVIVNFSSGWGRSTAPEVAPYCASKWAIEGLTAALAAELPEGLAAVALNPGIIDTAMLQSCFGESSSSYSKPAEWAERSAPFLLNLGPADNGSALTVPGEE